MSKIARALLALIGGSTPLRCVHCAREKIDAVHFVAGPRIYICDSCARDAAVAYAAGSDRVAFMKCSFCGTNATSVELGTDHDRAICGDCIDLVEAILDQAEHDERPAS